jgi:hypothetical protein
LVANVLLITKWLKRKWLRQQSKGFYADGFDALVKRWDKCINVDGGHVEKYMFCPRFKYQMFYVLHSFVHPLPIRLHGILLN